MQGLAAEGKVRLRWRRPSQHHWTASGTQMSHFGIRSRTLRGAALAERERGMGDTLRIRNILICAQAYIARSK
jgi:hypothetical protein